MTLLIVLKSSVFVKFARQWVSASALKVEKFIALCVDLPNLHLYFSIFANPKLSFAIKLTSFYYRTRTFFATQSRTRTLFRSLRAEVVSLVLDSRERHGPDRPRGAQQSRSDPPVEGARLAAHRHIAQAGHQARRDLQGVPRRPSASDYERRWRYGADDGGGLGQFHTFLSYLYLLAWVTYLRALLPITFLSALTSTVLDLGCSREKKWKHAALLFLVPLAHMCLCKSQQLLD